ncbi:Hypothetical protein PHPALM_4015 [Phytophthora palmivora]|uniref:Uncharacterized protein n=1 Tax=Phytophthora palmivora TaxID=4796 RepID=A0A2P4YKY6_9STRA|nr:Hypothetical protein PHPALM_4015 [Phytophthora palmivora]
MDGTLPSYEAAMREARAYLRRRDLSSEDEIPLYFAWQRLYAAANANLSTDFVHETKAELRARQEARLAPRRGIPPPLFTSFDKVRRTSAQASAYLRSRTSSDVAIEMMARRYRREAEKLRSSREKMMNSLDDAERRMKSKLRQKSPEEEVDELLESIGHRGIDLVDNDLLSGKSTVNKLTGASRNAVKRVKKTKQRLQTSEDDDQHALSDDQRSSFARKYTVRKSGIKGKLGGANNKDNFRDDFEVDSDPAKAAELRRSSLSTQNPTAIPSYSTVANVAAFTAQVSDWRMPPDIDNAPLSTELSQKGVALHATAGGKRLSGANELRESVLVDGEEGDMTLNSSLGSSNLEEDELDPDMDTGRPSPTNRTKRKVVEKDKTTSSRHKQGANGDSRPDRPGGFSDAPSSTIDVDSTLTSNKNTATRGSEFHQKLIQLSHAVGDMQVKIQGKQIEVTFKGALDNETESKRGGTAVKSSSKQKWTSADQKVLNTAEKMSQQSDAKGIPQSAEKQDQSNTKNVHVGISSGGDDNSRKDQRFGDQQLNKNDYDQQGMRRTFPSAAISPAIYEGQSRQIQSSSPQREIASKKTSATTSIHGEPNDAYPLREQLHSSKPERESDKGEAEVAQRVTQFREQSQKNAQGVSEQRKQGGVRFADTASSHGSDNYDEEQHSSDQTANRYKSDQQQMGSDSTSSAPPTYKKQPRQIRSSSTREIASTTMSSAAESLEDDDIETKNVVPSREQHRFIKEQANDEATFMHGGEESLNEALVLILTRAG